ncbi:MAG TPA: hypothetical protein VM802_27640 [Chitinophaga sp.]|uniref:hypothetical protein n=1 Tax=Chitinophaga sp. TaxID=1869181 RepID=UPI002C13340C|nr:hypothetical protein [Chitinophaga sp.]HVI48673.1 hypothetical protein [Chitinophaga sp.]
MKNLVIAFALMVAAAPAFAQTATPAQQAAPAKQQAPAKIAKQLPPAEQRAAQYADELKQKLSLTDDQYKKVLAVNTECIRRKDALKAGGDQDKAKFKEISEYRKQQFQTILTPDQQAKLKDMHGDHHGKKKDGKTEPAAAEQK